jgi:uncharacterized metal-binding protein YceD (DUF177 family)
MKKSDEFIIQFEGLKYGSHDYEFEIRDSFFESFGDQEFSQSSIKVQLNLFKDSNMMILNFIIHGSAKFSCDRCIDEYNQPLSGSYRLIVKEDDESYQETDEILVIRKGEHELDVEQYIYEFVELSLPGRRICSQSADGKECNPEIIRKLNQMSVIPESESTDPRWEVLKKLK